MYSRTDKRETGPTHKLKNCNTWEDWEPEGNSPAANLCHGGFFQGEHHSPCPSRFDCKRATLEKNGTPSSSTGFRRHGLSIIGSNGSGVPSRTTLPSRHAEREEPIHITRGDEDQPYMSTPYVTPQNTIQHSPTFLPDKEEGILVRLIKNIFQGAINAIFFQGYNLSRAVDFFPHRKKAQEEDEQENKR